MCVCAASMTPKTSSTVAAFKRVRIVSVGLVIATGLSLVGCTATPPTAPKACTLTQANAYLTDVAVSTITNTGKKFPLPEVLNAGTGVICAGDFVTSDSQAYRPAVSIAVLQGGTKVYDTLAITLKSDGYPAAELSGQSTHGWNDGKYQIYAVKLSDQMGAGGTLFGSDKDLILVVAWKVGA